MPNKDSFTFSDKLKKSKSLPLSKRIPSRVGGDGKAKRTLIQRAQRDLPFIIVAAAALLLLPLLSRNSGTDTIGFEGSGYDDFVGESLYNYPSTGDSEIVPSTGYRDPMDFIITKRSGLDSQGFSDSYEPEDTPAYMSPDQPSFRDEMSQRDSYKNVAKPSIRNAVQRKATAIGAFRNRAMSFGGSTSGLSRNLAIGGASTVSGASAPRVGVRPVALQPLSSAGTGRVLTGEGLYAEAARSLGALNQGSAKKALFEAQLRDVDGAPLGAAGAPRKSSSRISSQGTVPAHKFGYTNERPWWWDMMKDRSQRLWELWNYNWQKALSDSLIKVSTNLAMCLLTGSENGSVKNFLGVKGGSKDVCCLIDGMELCAGDIGDYTSSTSGSGDSKETTNNSFSSIQAFCSAHGAKTYVSESGAKNFLQARLECMGLKAGKMSWASKTRYSANCEGVNKTPMVYKASATRKDGKVREKKQEKIVVYLKAKPRDKNIDTGTRNKEFVIALNRTNSFSLSEKELAEINKNCEITRVGSFTTDSGARSSGDRSFRDEYDKSGSAFGGDLNLPKDIQNKVKAQYEYCLGGGQPKEFVDEDEIMDEVSAKIIEVCPIWYSDGIVGDRKVNDMQCNTMYAGPNFVEIDKLTKAEFSVDVTNPKDNLFAIFLEEVQSAQVSNGKPGVIVKYIVKDSIRENSAGNAMAHSNVQMNNGEITSATYTVPYYRAGKSTESTQSTTVESVPGNGVVFWLMTNKQTPIVEVGHVFEGHTISQIDAEDLIGPTAGYKEGQCFYSWGCNGNECSNNTKQFAADSFCKGEDGVIYKAVASQGYYFQKSNTPADEKDIAAAARNAKAESADKFKASLPQCSPICKHKEGSYGVWPDGKGLNLSLADMGVENDVLDKCPVCNPEQDQSSQQLVDLSNIGRINSDCSFQINATFCTNQFSYFGKENRSKGTKCVNLEEKMAPEVKSLAEQLEACYNKKDGDVTIGLYGWTSTAGDAEKNKVLSLARTIKVAEIVYKTIIDKDKNSQVSFVMEDNTGDGFNRGRSIDKTGQPTEEQDYIAAFKTRYQGKISTSSTNPIVRARDLSQDPNVQNACLSVETAERGLSDAYDRLNDESKKALGEGTHEDIIDLLREEKTLEAKNKLTGIKDTEGDLLPYKVAMDTYIRAINCHKNSKANARKLTIYISGQGPSKNSTSDEDWAKCIAGKVVGEGENYTEPVACSQ